MSEYVWIDRAAALQLMKNSRWGQIKRPNTSLLEFRMPATTGMTASEKAREKFSLYIEMSLDAFEEDNWDSVRTDQNGHKEYREDILRKFVGSAMKREIEDEFGEIPRGII